MKCRDVRKALNSGRNIRHPDMEKHLNKCKSCRSEAALSTMVQRGFDELSAETRIEMEKINWEVVPNDIMTRIRLRSHEGRSLFNPGKTIVVLTTAALFIIGFAFLFELIDRTSFRDISSRSLGVIESKIVKREMIEYLDETHMVITDLMENANSGGLYPRGMSSSGEKVAELLAKRKFFENDLEKSQLANAKDLMNRIDLIFYEVVEMDETAGEVSGGLDLIRDLVERDRLLFKIRLVRDEIKGMGV